MGPDDAARAVEFIEPRVVIPMHYSTWEPIEQDPNEFRDLVGGHARSGLVEHEHLRVGGEDHAQLEFALVPVRQGAGELEGPRRESDPLEHLLRAGEVVPESGCRPEPAERVVPRRLARESDVLMHGEVREDVRDLEGASDPLVDRPVHRDVGDVLAVELDGPRRRGQHPAHEVEERRLPRPVRADDRVEGPSLDRDVHPVHRHERAEALREAGRPDDGLPWCSWVCWPGGGDRHPRAGSDR